VWRVRQGGRDDVIKVLFSANAPRVEREVDAMRAVNSPHVMKFLESLTLRTGENTLAAIRGEYIAGGTIATRLKAGDWPDERQALNCARSVLLGLQALHGADRVHRDIKPANVGLRGGSWEEAVVLDLGLVRDLAATSITRYPELLGTIPFMAPEQLRMERAVKRTDVFAVGVLLFLLLTRELPYVSDSQDRGVDAERLRRLMRERSESEDWPRWTRFQDRLSEDAAALLSRLLAADAYNRPRVSQAIDEIDALLAERD
jgi:eukaryotic-like serine/threonine-protein kinase